MKYMAALIWEKYSEEVAELPLMYHEEGLQSRRDLGGKGWRSWLARLITIYTASQANAIRWNLV